MKVEESDISSDLRSDQQDHYRIAAAATFLEQVRSRSTDPHKETRLAVLRRLPRVKSHHITVE